MEGGQGFPPPMSPGCNCTSGMSLWLPRTPTHPLTDVCKAANLPEKTAWGLDIKACVVTLRGLRGAMWQGGNSGPWTRAAGGNGPSPGRPAPPSSLGPAFPGPRGSSAENGPHECTVTVTPWAQTASAPCSAATQEERSLFFSHLQTLSSRLPRVSGDSHPSRAA